jgi:hypothetical protein
MTDTARRADTARHGRYSAASGLSTRWTSVHSTFTSGSGTLH